MANLIRISDKNQPRICVLTFPITSDAGIIPISNLIHVLRPLSSDLQLIIGNTGYAFFKGKTGIRIHKIEHKKGTNILARVTSYLWTQLKISRRLVKIARDVDLFIFFVESQHLLVPMLAAKLSGKKVILAFAASTSKISKIRKDIFSGILKFLEQINCILSDRIIVYSERMIGEYGLERYRNKIAIAHEHFLDFTKFNVTRRLSERGNLVGYIGRLSEEKGVLNFVRAISEVLERMEGVTFLIGGNGRLQGQLEKYLNKKQLNDEVKVLPWIPHERLPAHLNDLKLLVLPSYTEGLPNIVLEAMACGTPVLATPVGVVPDLIRDGETGFLVKENSPQSIAENVIRALGHPNLECIARNAEFLVEAKFTYEATVKQYKRVLDVMLKRDELRLDK